MISEHRVGPRIPLQASQGSIVASIQVDLDEDVLRQFRTDLLGLLDHSGLVRVILDVSGVEIMDAADYEGLRKTIVMAELMGARCILAGLQAGVVASLVELNVAAGDTETVLNLDEAFSAMEREIPHDDSEMTEIRVGGTRQEPALRVIPNEPFEDEDSYSG